MKTKQTAVEWLLQQVNGTGWGNFRIDIPKEIIEQAKQMEKEQIIQARDNGIEDTLKGYSISNEDYYNQTFNQ